MHRHSVLVLLSAVYLAWNSRNHIVVRLYKQSIAIGVVSRQARQQIEVALLLCPSDRPGKHIAFLYGFNESTVIDPSSSLTGPA